MNSYAYNFLPEEEQDNFEEKAIFGEDSYCEMYSIDKLSSMQIDDFLTDFMIRKVMAEKYLLKKIATVMRRFTKWLKNNDYITEEKFDIIYSTINEKKDSLPKAAELSDLIYDESIKNEFNKYNSYVEVNYAIAKIKPGKLWVRDYMEGGEELGPVVVPKKITELAEKDFFVYLELGKKDDKYYIVNSGHVYPV
ncbi:MAG: hypothetical protein ACOC2I_04890 [Halanaerobium sp.]